MDWTDQIDAYCERTDFGLWSEPVNAVTNLAFILVGLWMWRRTAGVQGGRVLSAILVTIGVGSGLFHTFATGWASLADTAPIGLFILTYLYLTNRHILGWPIGAAALGTAAFVPFAAVVVPAMNALPFFRVSNFYWTVPILLLVYAATLLRHAPATRQGFVIGAAILSVSITLRSLDQTLCAALPIGTHFLWHLLNAAMLGWMIRVYLRHMLAGDGLAGNGPGR